MYRLFCRFNRGFSKTHLYIQSNLGKCGNEFRTCGSTKGWIFLSAALHCHTRLSNGSLGIEDLIILAKKRGISTIAITDHDCLAGTVRGKVIGNGNC